ncbi:MAG TPA: hypothetical protein VMW71_08785 [Thermoplasmata archaeon]|nr:hypothetical protein [Thermoplasmata archaeon]
MRKVVAYLVSAIVAGLLLVPGCASAKAIMLIVPDEVGDLGVNWDYETYLPKSTWGDNSQIAQAGYFDRTLFWFGLKGNTYTFGMELAADLPQEGDPLPAGVTLAEYGLWLDKEAWDWVTPVEGYFMLVFRYDGVSYSAALLDWPSETVKMYLPFTIDGPRFEMEFSADSIDNLETFWLFTCVVVYFGQSLPLWPDSFDLDSVEGQIVTSIPWSSV